MVLVSKVSSEIRLDRLRVEKPPGNFPLPTEPPFSCDSTLQLTEGSIAADVSAVVKTVAQNATLPAGRVGCIKIVVPKPERPAFTM